jgi:Zn-dependent protease with chaperone function
MTARLIRRGASREDWHHALARLALEALVLLFVWLIVVSAAAADEPKPRFPAPVFPGGKLPADFDPQKFLESFFGKAARHFDNNELLDKVEVSWDEEVRLGQQLLDDLKQRLAAQKKTLVDRGRDVEYVSQLAGQIQPQMREAQRYRKLHIHVTNLSGPNAYALPGGHLIVTREILDQSGCEAAVVCVIGHELSHVRNYDIRFSLIVGVLVGSVALLADFFLRFTFWGGRGSSRSSRDSGGNGLQAIVFVVAIVLAIMAPIAARLVQLAVSRQREYLADASSVELTRNPHGLEGALAKIAEDQEVLEVANRATQHLYFTNPIKKFEKRSAGIMSTHPPIVDRINRLRALTGEQPLDAADTAALTGLD